MDTTTALYPELQRRSPTRSPAWRWERAQALVRQGRYVSPRRDDAPTGRAVRYLRQLRRCRQGTQLRKLAVTYHDIHAARQLHERGGTAVVAVQARLLARQSFEEVARRTSVTVEAVKTYEALFFNVTDHLDAKDWVVVQAIRWWEF